VAKDVTYRKYRAEKRPSKQPWPMPSMTHFPWVALLIAINIAVVVYYGDPREMVAQASALDTRVTETPVVAPRKQPEAAPVQVAQVTQPSADITAPKETTEAPQAKVAPVQPIQPPAESTVSALARLAGSYNPAAGLKPSSEITDNLRVTLKRGQMPFDALLEVGLDRSQVSGAFNSLGKLVDFRRIRPGHHFTAWITAEGDLRRLDIYQGVLASYQARLNDGVWSANQVSVEKETLVSAVEGEVTISLWDALIKSGEKAALVSLFVEIFAWDIDFFSDVRQGAKFRILVEKQHGNGEFIGYGNILAAEFVQGDEVHQAFAHVGEKDLVSYFDKNGHSMRKQLLKAPVKYANVTSGFGKRRHPILGYTRSHNGVDYGVARGTPIWSVGDGRVVRAGRNGGYGNFISIRHANGWVSQYAHLHKIHVRVGQRVLQKEIIGLVGSTGMSTGPHLHYELKKDGRFMNPQKQKFAKGKSLKGEALEKFKKNIPEFLRKMSRQAVADNKARFEPWEG
jgi:murein DD-endopeptidase MepM/ murein hydrolase activator NlpD